MECRRGCTIQIRYTKREKAFCSTMREYSFAVCSLALFSNGMKQKKSSATTAREKNQNSTLNFFFPHSTLSLQCVSKRIIIIWVQAKVSLVYLISFSVASNLLNWNWVWAHILVPIFPAISSYSPVYFWFVTKRCCGIFLTLEKELRENICYDYGMLTQEEKKKKWQKIMENHQFR